MGSQLKTFHDVVSLYHRMDESDESLIVDTASIFKVDDKDTIGYAVHVFQVSSLSCQWSIPQT